jgi:hypothetical protein
MIEQMRRCKKTRKKVYIAENLDFCIFPREYSTGVKNLGCGPRKDDKRDKNVHDAGNRRTQMNKRYQLKEHECTFFYTSSTNT